MRRCLASDIGISIKFKSDDANEVHVRFEVSFKKGSKRSQS